MGVPCTLGNAAQKTAVQAPATEPPPMRFSTTAVPSHRRFEFWRDAICSAFVALDLECDRRRPFSSDLSLRRTGSFDLIDVAGSAQQVRRSTRLIDEDPAEQLIVMLQRAGSGVARQDGCELALVRDGITVLDSRRPYSLSFESDFRQTVLKIPVGTLARRLGPTAAYVGHSIEPGTALGRLACLAIDEVAHESNAAAARPLQEVALDLLALALLESRQGDGRAPRMATLRVRWAKAYALEALRDPELSPARIAAHQGVSPRLLQRLFAAERSNLAEFIVEQRLLRCERELRDPLHAPRSITDIALSWGFNDSSRFAKVFRRRFGESPGEARRSALFAVGPDVIR